MLAGGEGGYGKPWRIVAIRVSKNMTVIWIKRGDAVGGSNPVSPVPKLRERVSEHR